MCQPRGKRGGGEQPGQGWGGGERRAARASHAVAGVPGCLPPPLLAPARHHSVASSPSLHLPLSKSEDQQLIASLALITPQSEQGTGSEEGDKPCSFWFLLSHLPLRLLGPPQLYGEDQS